MTQTPVGRFVAAIDQYRTARDEQHVLLGTREHASVPEADAEVRESLRALIADLN